MLQPRAQLCATFSAHYFYRPIWIILSAALFVGHPITDQISRPNRDQLHEPWPIYQIHQKNSVPLLSERLDRCCSVGISGTQGERLLSVGVPINERKTLWLHSRWVFGQREGWRPLGVRIHWRLVFGNTQPDPKNGAGGLGRCTFVKLIPGETPDVSCNV